MEEGTLDTIDKLLEGALDEVDGTEARYKIKSAQQLLHVLQQRHDDLDIAVEDVSDQDIIDNLRDLGYLR
ncbi:hypothetical protein GLW36_12630 [Halorubrum terrestre]|uniref:CopG family transcriptional regulator n=1 Tax=Halorubrum distributum TaxID=29283 RepID=A0A6B1IR10_9EURY|nr:hypothetical protein [Halorubrum terrestre]MYL17485.1 hypothetical protein [Halorubrum terrestre]